MTTSVQTALAAAATKNTTLLQILTATDHAAPVLPAQRELLANLTLAASESSKRLARFTERRLKEFQDHEQYRDSLVRRFAAKATGLGKKFEEKAAKEEREYFEVLSKEEEIRAYNTDVKRQVEEVTAYIEDLERDKERNEAAQRELNELYEGIFRGRTEGMPEEDEVEGDVQVKLGVWREVKGREAKQEGAVGLVRAAKGRMANAVKAMDEALVHSTDDLWGGGRYTDMMERNALQKAEREMGAARMAVWQARQMDPMVEELKGFEVMSWQDFISDVLIDTPFTDYEFHKKIKASAEEVREMAAVVDRILAEANARHQLLLGELRVSEKDLQKSRDNLQRIRAAVFERFAGAEKSAAT